MNALPWSKPLVLVTDAIPPRVLAELETHFAVTDDLALADGVLATLRTRIDAAYLDVAGRNLRAIANYAVGVDNIDLEAARTRGIAVTNTPDVLTRATAEHAVGLMLALLRRIAEGDRLVRGGRPWAFALDFMLGEGLDGKTVGIVGGGRIGLETARLVEAFGARTIVVRSRDSLAPLLEGSDVVSLHCPLTERTRHLIDARALGRMRPTAILVNTARGPVVDEAALATALERGEIAGAALDVFEHEPQVDDRLLALDNVVLTPHLGSATRTAREAMGFLAVESLRALLVENRVPPNVVVPPRPPSG